MLRYDQVPFTKVRQLRFERGDPYMIKFKLSHADKVFSSVSIRTHARATKTRSRGKQPTVNMFAPRIQKIEKTLSTLKIDDLVSMLPYMPLVDQEYYRSVNIF